MSSANDQRGADPASWRGIAEVIPQWSAPPGIRAFVTGRRGGVSEGPWGLDGGRPGGLNLGARCGDAPQAVARNRDRLASCLPAAPVWLRQVHGTDVHRAFGPVGAQPEGEPVADASVTDRPGTVLAVLTADCLPVFLTDAEGRAVGVAHAGWRGLAAGVLEQTVAALRALLPGNPSLLAWLGPAIGPAAFEVGDEVREAFCASDASMGPAFTPGRRPGKWQADLYAIARRRLAATGVGRIDGGGFCTWSETGRFWSYRRAAASGRIASVIWIDPRPGA